MVTRYFSEKNPATYYSPATDRLTAVSDELPAGTPDGGYRALGAGWHNIAEIEVQHIPSTETVVRSPRSAVSGSFPLYTDTVVETVSKATGIDAPFLADTFDRSDWFDMSNTEKLAHTALHKADDLMDHIQSRQFKPEKYSHTAHPTNDGDPPIKTPTPRRMLRRAGIEYAKSISELNKAVPMEFFQHTPSETTLNAAFADPSMRLQAPLLGAYAHMKYVPEGKSLIASGDLSPHSSKMVKHAQKLGLPVSTHAENPDAEVTNDSDFESRRIHIDSLNYRIDKGIFTEIPQEEMNKAWDHYRSLRGRPAKGAKPVMSEQFDSVPHPQLPGMEGY